MRPNYVTNEGLRNFIRTALSEDLGDGDHTSLSAIPEGTQQRARLLIKQDGILAGVEVMKAIWEEVDGDLDLEIFKEDGSQVSSGDIAFTVKGSARSILAGERLVLNVMQRMSGVATRTRRMVDMIQGTKASIMDTRKTTPNFRMLEKWAVAIGGGTNHRFGLFDQILLKDNHIDMAGGLTNALKGAKEYLGKTGKQLLIEVETRSLDEVKEAVQEGGADIIMLDNMMPSEMREAVNMIGGKCKVEASGGITENTISEVAEAGVDYISVGALTHSYVSLDMSLKAY